MEKDSPGRENGGSIQIIYIIIVIHNQILKSLTNVNHLIDTIGCF